MFQLYKDLKIAYYVIALSVAIPLAAYGGWEEKVGLIVWALISSTYHVRNFRRIRFRVRAQVRVQVQALPLRLAKLPCRKE